MADYEITPTGIEGVMSEDAYQTYQANKDLDAIRSGVAQTDQDTIDESINGLSTNGVGMATSTDLSKGYLDNLSNLGLLPGVNEAQRRILTEQQEAKMGAKLRPYDVAIGDARKQLEMSLGRANAILTRNAGGDLGIDTANQSAIGEVTRQGEANIYELREARESARHNMRTEQLTELSLMIERQEKSINDIIDKANKQRLDLYNIQNEQAQQSRLMLQTSFDIASKLPMGETYTDKLTGLTITGIQQPDPLFSSKEIISLMEQIPFGETQSLNVFNPMSGKEETYKLTGIMKKDINTEYYQSVDPGGNIHFLKLDKNTDEVTEIAVAQGAGKGTTYAPPSSFTEWQYAGGKAGTGMSYSEWVGKAPASTGDITNDERTKLNATISKLPVGQQDSAFGAVATFQNARDILDILDSGVKTGIVAGPTQRAQQISGTSSEEFNKFTAAATTFTANFIKAISGVQVSDRERKFLMKALPSENKQENVNRENLKQLTEFLKNKYELQLNVSFSDFPAVIPSLDASSNNGQTTKSIDDYINSLNL